MFFCAEFIFIKFSDFPTLLMKTQIRCNPKRFIMPFNVYKKGLYEVEKPYLKLQVQILGIDNQTRWSLFLLNYMINLSKQEVSIWEKKNIFTFDLNLNFISLFWSSCTNDYVYQVAEILNSPLLFPGIAIDTRINIIWNMAQSTLWSYNEPLHI